MKNVISIFVLLLVSGCANFEYDITSPAESGQHIGKAEVRFTRNPVEYRLQTAESRLIMMIYNPSDTPINLLGDKSSVVDQKGQSHPLRAVTIAPHSFVKIIMPPYRPQIEPAGPSIGFGIGVIGSVW